MTYQIRVIKEKKKLDKKLAALNEFIASVGFDAVLEREQQRLRRQVEIMKLYSDVLAERISNFGIFDIDADEN